MAFPNGMYRDPALYVEHREFMEMGCGGCALHKPKPDRSEFHCIADCKQWPDATNKTCSFFKKRLKEKRA